MKTTKILRCIVVDDEPLAREVIARYISRVPSLQLVDECSNAVEVMEVIKTSEVDLIFLDIQMPEIRGTDLIRILKNPPLIVLTTAYQEYALQGYELDVVDYLLKPIQFERFLKAIDKSFRLLGDHTNYKSNIPARADSQTEPYLYFRTDRKTVKVMLSDILYVEGMGNYVKVITDAGTIITKNSMSAVETMLPEDQFVRTHRSFIVSRTKIKSFSHEIVEIGKHQIPIGKLYKNNVMKVLENGK